MSSSQGHPALTGAVRAGRRPHSQAFPWRQAVRIVIVLVFQSRLVRSVMFWTRCSNG